MTSKFSTKLWEKDEKVRQHDHFVQKYSFALRICDITAVIIILLNFTAVFTTTFLVAKTGYESGQDVTIYELNPAQQKINNYEAHPETNKYWSAAVKAFAFWFVLICLYVFVRRTIRTEYMFTLLIICLVWYFMVLGTDAFNNLGYFIGQVLYK